MSGLRLVVLFLFFAISSSAQSWKGVITDQNSGNYLNGVSIQLRSQITYSDEDGKFSLSNVKIGDTVAFFSIGYHRVNHIIRTVDIESHVTLIQNPILIDEVKVRALRNYHADSLKFREEFAKTFNHAKPKFKDIFIPKNYASNAPRPSFLANNSTAALISIDVLSVISMLRKRKSPQSKLQKVLIKEEEERYVDNIFSKAMIFKVTGLEGDSLQTFMQLYRPPVDSARAMSEYEIIMYIKDSYDKYVDREELKK